MEGVSFGINPFVWGIYNLIDGGILRAVLQHNTFTENQAAVLFGVCFFLCAVLSYLIGSINCALVISRLFYHEDVREKGSGNAGATNVLRNYGKKAAILTLLGDGFKGVLCILIASAVFGAPESEMLYFHQVHACYLSAFFCVLGHVLPCFSKFRGGKGVATMALAILALNPLIFAILLALFVALVAMSKYVSLGSVVGAMFYPVILHSFDSMEGSSHYGVGLYALMLGLLVLWAHRGNLKRITSGTERKLSFSRQKSETVSENDTSDAASSDHSTQDRQ